MEAIILGLSIVCGLELIYLIVLAICVRAGIIKVELVGVFLYILASLVVASLYILYFVL